MKNILLVTAIAALLPLSISHATDIEAGKAKAATCTGCHGREGISANPQWPNLAGQQELYLKNQIIAFRDGGRENAMMAAMVKNLNDVDAANIAAYYASIGK